VPLEYWPIDVVALPLWLLDEIRGTCFAESFKMVIGSAPLFKAAPVPAPAPAPASASILVSTYMPRLGSRIRDVAASITTTIGSLHGAYLEDDPGGTELGCSEAAGSHGLSKSTLLKSSALKLRQSNPCSCGFILCLSPATRSPRMSPGTTLAIDYGSGRFTSAWAFCPVEVVEAEADSES